MELLVSWASISRERTSRYDSLLHPGWLLRQVKANNGRSEIPFEMQLLMNWPLIVFQGWRLDELLKSDLSHPEVFAGALALSFFFGAIHALSPGHGKALVAAYLAGTAGRVRDAIVISIVITATHTATVFALGILALVSSKYLLLDAFYPWLTLVSGLLVVIIGGWLLRKRLKQMTSLEAHGHTHSHLHHHHHHSVFTSAERHPDQQQPYPQEPLNHEDHHHGPPPPRSALIGLGISAGLIPCAEALVLLLVAINFGRILEGLALLVAFSVGLATVLALVGIAVVKARPLLGRFTGEGWLSARLPVISAIAVVTLGLLLVGQGSYKLLSR